jgi:putative SOS response-associated peptidase YedK
MRWGLVPSWAKDLKIGYSTFNARAETIDVRSAFRSAWHAGRRCLVIADGYYEWRDRDKQPFAVTLGDRRPMTFAGLWDCWRAPGGDTIRSFAIVTTSANALLAPLHDRMRSCSPRTAGPIGKAKGPWRKRCSKPCLNPIPATP